MDQSAREHGYVTVARLRKWLLAFDDDATVVVATGIGYEEPKPCLVNARAVLVPHRYVAEKGASTVIALVGMNGG